MDEDLESRVEALVHAGRHAAAADLCVAAGEVSRAGELYAAVWQWDEAIAITEQHGLLDEAYRHALSAGDRAACGRLLGRLESQPELAVRAAVHAEGKGLYLDAARLREAAGEAAAAAELYERSSEYRDAARCRLALGQPRQAGMLYEKRLREDPEDAQSGLALGRILAQFGRYDHAVRALQRTLHDPAVEPAALRLMVACFSALGMDEAAGSRLDALRVLEPEQKATIPEFLEEAFGDPRGIAGLAASDDGERLLAGRYRVMGPLGAGATGRVLRAHDAFHERDVAIKVLNVGGGSLGRDAFVRFAREARVAAGIRHPNVVRVFEFNPDGPFLVMELMVGGTLEDRLVGPDDAPCSYPPPLTKAMASAVLSALEAVHRRGVVHRDLKPANIFFTEAGEVKLGDFGVAHLTDLGATLTGALIGTLAYMAPEQITGERRPNASTDLYAFGVILFRCLTGRLPFEGPDFVAQHLEKTPPRPSEVAPWLTDAFDPLIGRLLQKAAEDRPASANQVMDALRDLPFDAVANDAVPAAAPIARTSRPPPPSSEGRYGVVVERTAQMTLVEDELLQRLVERWKVREDGFDRVRAFARADSPFLQAVYSVDEVEGEALLEHPLGVSLSELPEDDPRRPQVIHEVRAALSRLHRERVAHGGVDASQVVVGEARACLRVSLESAPFDPSADWAALDEMGGRGRAR